MTLSVAELQPALHQLFHDAADSLARDAGFCKRARKLTGSAFAQSLVFSLLENPDATLDDFADAADELGILVTPQAFDQRFTPAAADFLRDLFLEAFNAAFNSLTPALLPLLRRFHGVFLRDATLVNLPPALADAFPGRAGRHAPGGRAAALKLVFEAEVTSGALTGVSVLAGTANEKTAEVAGGPLPEGALLLEDMGFLSGGRLQACADAGVYFLSRIPAWSAVFDEKGRRLDLVKLLRRQIGDTLELPARILHGCKMSVRLLATRVPPAQAEARRTRVRAEAKTRGRQASQKKLDLCDWTILVSNAPASLVGVREAAVTRRVRWQVELVFKVFKSEGGLDRTRSKDPCRVLCEVFAKLLGMVVQHWVLLSAGYVMLVHSARRASRRVRRWSPRVLAALGRVGRLGRVVAGLARVLRRHCRVKRRKAEPSTFDRLAELDPEFDQPANAA
jgi:hypothetical protein